ncbi:hypothetical protein RF11_03045 [Thelohanellus kitauei]|uniref:Uncharacterized protein n=1 Tax=Thelohanellus kitauei TaxID=669202 RepID=A0A0C2MXD4_THEKT|nr:hypothetical protein RF11_03045 [Thelohanellus kitauei]
MFTRFITHYQQIYMQYRAVDTIRYSFSLFRPLEEVREEINELIFLGESYKDSKMYEEAGRIYFEVARLIEVYFRHYETAQEKFQESARCFRKIHSQTLYNVYEKILDLLVKDNTLNLALQDCFVFGYKFGTVYRDEEKREAFYKRGDQIREQHGKSHRCPKTSFKLSEYEDDVQKAFKDYDKVYPIWS